MPSAVVPLEGGSYLKLKLVEYIDTGVRFVDCPLSQRILIHFPWLDCQTNADLLLGMPKSRQGKYELMRRYQYRFRNIASVFGS